MKILLLPGPYGISHASRMLQIARELQSYGCQFKASITKEQRVLPWGEIPRTEIPEIPKTNSAEEAFYGVASYELLQRHLEQELNLIHSFQPDFILADLRLTAAISSRITNTPLITIQNASMIKSFDPHGIAKDRNVQDLTKNRDQITVIPAFKKLANQNGLQHLTSLFDVLSGDLQWICDLEELFPIKNLMPHQSFIGPLIFEQEDSTNQLPATFPKRENEVLIYITIGNTGDKELIPKFIKAFGGDSFLQGYYYHWKKQPDRHSNTF